MNTTVHLSDRTSVEDFLYAESDLLDRWRLDDWFALFAEDARYEVPGTDAAEDAKASESLFYIADDYVRLKHRILRLNNKAAHSEYPHSRVFRLISNVRAVEVAGDQAVYTSKFITMRSRDDVTDRYFGRHQYRLKATDGVCRILEKRTTLDTGSLRPQGRVSIIL